MLKSTMILICGLCLSLLAEASVFPLAGKGVRLSVVYAAGAGPTDSITAHLLAEDIRRVSGYLPPVLTDIRQAKGTAIVIGQIGSSLIHDLVSKNSLLNKGLAGKWECYGLEVLQKPLPNLQSVLVITGSDTRGTAYGVFALSGKIGVSPWYWWADVQPVKQTSLSVNIEPFVSDPPSVKFRGIFINDEDWGLRPWAAKTFEPETGDIGPKTYARVFELLLRLKANLIWPAMHPGTKPFFHYPGNLKMAAAYSIVIGSSHAEPMLRNNVGEWDVKTMGEFNYITNRDRVYRYWEERVKESSYNDVIYTLGMRGVHDSGIEGVKTPAEAVPLLERIFADQRRILQQYVGKDVAAVPQAFIAYKEVLDIYDHNLKLPEEATLVWPDDNYGYIQRLGSEQEQARAGGSGVYYHASYWGRPHDYLWLGTTHPALIREEMMKATDLKANRLWVLNAGDIKPLEYNIQLFLDMAYRSGSFKDSRSVRSHLLAWTTSTFGKNTAAAICDVLWQYYQLAFERKPEYMGWSQTEPTTETTYTSYNHLAYGDEARQRIDRYEVLEKQVRALRSKIPSSLDVAFYQLVYYPVVCSSLMNKKFLYRDKAELYARQNRLSALDYARLSEQCYESILRETRYYNDTLAGGKWKNMMSMKPRDLPVFQAPVLPEIKTNSARGWNIKPEASVRKSSSSGLPVFRAGDGKQYFVDLFLNSPAVVQWTAVPSHPWIKLSATGGTLDTGTGRKEMRLQVSIDPTFLPGRDAAAGTITFSGGGRQYQLAVSVLPAFTRLQLYKGFAEKDGYLSMPATSYSRLRNSSTARWEPVEGLGYTGSSMEALPFSKVPFAGDTASLKQAPAAEYDFYLASSSDAVLTVFTIPSFPLNTSYSMRYAVAVDDGKPVILDFRTIGRSDEWKQNVLRNNAERKLDLRALAAGRHVLSVFMVDPGVLLDRMLITLNGQQKAYSAVPETKLP